MTATVLSLRELVTLDPIGTATVLCLTVESALPQGSDVIAGTMEVMDGVQGLGQPVQNVITVEGQSRFPCEQRSVRLEFAPNRPPDCSAARLAALQCWPPSHTLGLHQVLGVTDPDGDPVAVTIDRISQDEPVLDARARSGICPDGVLVDSDGDGLADQAGLRCERSGTGDGRVYQVHFTAGDGKGGECGGAVSFCVPLRQTPAAVCVDTGQVFDATACPGGGQGGTAGGEVISLAEFSTLPDEPLFIRGDADWNEALLITDGILILQGLFQGRGAFDCADAADVNDDGSTDIADPIALFAYLYLGGSPPPPPMPAVGPDATEDRLGCQ